MRVITVGSLFAGIGGFDLAFARNGFEVRWTVEIEPACRNVLAKQFPEAKQYEDVRQAGAHNLERVDIVCGGWPCVDVSVAGQRRGIMAERSGLFFQMLRVIDELQPAFALFENVPGLLSTCSCARCRRACTRCGSIAGADDTVCAVCGGVEFRGKVLPNHRGADWFAVLSAFGVVGYHGATTLLDARWFGVAQRRRRLYGLFARADLGKRGGMAQARQDFGSLAGLCAEILAFSERLRGDTQASAEAGPDPASEAGASAEDDGGAEKVYPSAEATSALASNQVPAVMPEPPEVIAFDNGQGDPNTSEDGTAYALNGQSHGGVMYEMAHADEAIRENGDVALTLQQRMGTGGNQVPLVEAATDKAESTAQMHIAQSIGIRRLTPTEAERLQSFPDGWTAVGANGKKISDGARYRMLGNAICVNVVAWIAKRLRHYLELYPLEEEAK